LGIDVERGGAGVDTLNGGDEADLQYGGGGSDTLNGADNGNPYRRELQLGGDGNDTLSGGGVDLQSGEEGNDKIRDHDFSDYLSGGAVGDGDYLYGPGLRGGAGSDEHFGGDGGDVIDSSDGIAGNDTVDGGPGGDGCIIDRDTAPDPDVTNHYTNCEYVEFSDVP
jgi:Ca2+-binding RTX toxin-like protein